MFRGIDSLSTTPVLVVRLWFDGCRLLGDKTSGIFVNYPLLDNFFVLSNLQESFRDQDETVVEVQAYLVEEKIGSTDRELLDLVLRDLHAAFKPLIGRKLRESHFLRHKDVFTRHSPGPDQHRPGTRTSVPHFHLAGDWVSRSPEVWHMERAVVSGKLAACSVIEDAGGVGPTVRAVRKGGALFRGSAALARAITGFCRWIRSLAGGDGLASPNAGSVDAEWNSTIIFGVYKFPGQPTEQFVTGKFRNVKGQVTLSRVGKTCKVTGTFHIDLQSVDSGNSLRDCAIRTIVFGAPMPAHARFELTQVRLAEGRMEKMLTGEAVTGKCEGTFELNRISCTVKFLARVCLVAGGLASVLSTEDIVVKAADFGIDVGALEQHCDAVVKDPVHVRFRLAVPYVIR